MGVSDLCMLSEQRHYQFFLWTTFSYLPSRLPAPAAAAAPGKERRGWGLGEVRPEGETLAGLESGFAGRRVGRRGRWSKGGGGSREERPGLGP